MTYRLKQRSEEGFFTIWSLGLCVCILIIGGVFIDLWHYYDERRDVAQMVDAAAVAGAGRIDIPHYQKTGKVRLASNADNVAAAFLSQQAAQAGKVIAVNAKLKGTPGGSNQVEVTGTYKLDLAFVGLLGTNPDLTFSVTGNARPLQAGADGVLGD